MKPSRLIFVVAITVSLLLGASLTAAWILQLRPVTTISAGMPMANALDAMEQRGLESETMQFGGPHHAFDLPDGRAIVLFGDQRVDEIQVIANPPAMKNARAAAKVPAVTF